MLTAIIAGILTFILTLVGIPAFIRFYHKAHISGQQMHEDVRLRLERRRWGAPSFWLLLFWLVL